MLKQGGGWLLLGLLLWAAWTAWQPPLVTGQSAALVRTLPEKPGDAAELWRVLTRRMIVRKAADELGNSLAQRDLPQTVLLEHQEEVELHAFDDPRSFSDRNEAVLARTEWKKAGFDAELIRPDEQFGVALGRLYMVGYAQQLQRRLINARRPFSYHRRQLFIPTWRFTFAPAPYAEANALWLRVEAMGVADPVLIRESRFRAMFHDSSDSTQSP